MKRALITGITGQTGSYMADLLLGKGYEVFGMQRRSSSIQQTWRIDHILKSGNHIPEQVTTYYGDLTDVHSTIKLIDKVRPDEIYNFGGMSHVRISFDIPEYTAQVTGLGPLRLLETLRVMNIHKDIKFIQASSSEMFGASPAPQNEDTRFQPQSPYAASKCFAYYITKIYRTGYGMFACNSICFNHESSRRAEHFVMAKLIRGAIKIKYGLQDKIVMGNLEAKRDWGFALDYCKAIHLIMQYQTPDDWVVASGINCSIRELAEKIFGKLNLNFNDYYVCDPIYFRPNEVLELRGDSTKIRTTLGWIPEVNLDQLIDMMLEDAAKDYKKKK